MQDRQLTTSPGLILGGGVMATLSWCAVMYYLLQFDLDRALQIVAAGLVATIGATVGAYYQAWRTRPTRENLARARHDARHDALTGLANRTTLFENLAGALDESRRGDTTTGVLFLDLDRFKVINDSMGHDAGDELLKIVAGRLESAVRATDLVARFGGDEFVVVCRDLLSDRSVEAVATQILKAFQEPVSLRGSNQVASTSIGVAVARPGDERSAEELVRDADAAMYRAKKARSGYAVFDEAQRLQVINRLDIERDLVTALEQGELRVYYQPIVDMRSRRLYAFEALVRWHHPDRGLVSPGEFLAVAEEVGKMSDIGEFVLREALAQKAVWNHRYPHAAEVKIGVNLAEQQLLDTNLVDNVIQTVDWAGVPSEQVILEITEDVIVDHLDGLSSLRRLRDIGVNLSIDDFGTGQSSLSYVKQFDMVSALKIDKSFVTDVADSAASKAIVGAIVTMSKALGFGVVAEGVETERQVKQLMSMGIRNMQGYLFSAPIEGARVNGDHWFAPRSSTPARSSAQAPKRTTPTG